MTTSVSIAACPSADVQYALTDEYVNNAGNAVVSTEVFTIPAGETRQFYITSSRSLTLVEEVTPDT